MGFGYFYGMGMDIFMILKTYFSVFGFLPGCAFSRANIFMQAAKWLWLGFHFIISINITF